jgi:Secretion system C-terminal sorting domain
MKTLLFLLLCMPGSSNFPAFGDPAANASVDIGNNFWEIGSTPLDPITGWACGSITDPVTRKGSTHTLNILDSNATDSLYLYNEALPWYGVDNQKGLDTMRLYCRLHPFGFMSPGELLSAFVWMNEFLAAQPDTPLTLPDNGYNSPHKYIIQYNWWIDQYPLNLDFTTPVPIRVLSQIMGTANDFDRNLACNLAYNFSQLPQLAWDTAWAAQCWAMIADTRNDQMLRGEDTTPFTPVSIPPPYYPVPGASVAHGAIAAPSCSLTLSPNPASNELTVNYTLGHSGPTLILIYDETGNSVKPVVNGESSAGPNQVMVSLNDLASGHYFVRMSSGSDVVTQELIVQH